MSLPWMTVREAAKAMSYSEDTVRRLCKAGRLGALKITRSSRGEWRIPVSSVSALEPCEKKRANLESGERVRNQIMASLGMRKPRVDAFAKHKRNAG